MGNIYFGIGWRVTILLPIFFYHKSAKSLPSIGLGRVVTPPAVVMRVGNDGAEGDVGMSPLVSLKECCDFILNGTHGSPERVREGIPVFSAQNVLDGRLNFNTERFTTVAEYQAFSRRLTIEKGDVLLTIVGTIGRSAVLVDLGDAVADELNIHFDQISLEMIYRGLYHFIAPNFIRVNLNPFSLH